MNSKDVMGLKDFFADMAVKAINLIKEEGNTYSKVGNVKIVKAPGKSLKDTELINGVYIEKERVNAMMPDIVKNAKIAVIRKKLDVTKTEISGEIRITNPADIQKFLDQEEKISVSYTHLTLPTTPYV